MRTLAVKVKSYADHLSYASEGFEGAIFYALLSTVAILALSYVFLLGNMVWNIMERKALEVQAHKLATDVADLESSYLSMSGKVDLQLSQSLGFTEVKPTFTSRKAVGSLSTGKISKDEI